MRPFGLVRSLLGLAFCKASWAYHPTDSLMDADSAATGYLPNHNMDPSTIAGGTFGQIWSFTPPKSLYGLQEQFYAKPLVFTPARTGRQVVIAFSEQNRIYVIDAANGTVYTTRDMSTDQNPEAPFYVEDLGSCNDISGMIGITGTPVIDKDTETIYFWSKSYKVQGQRGYKNGAYRFHAVDVLTLQEKPGFPTWVEGTPADNDNTRYFTGGGVLQRTALNLINGVVYAGFGGHCDMFNYTGWVVGMRASNGAFVTAYSTNGGDRSPPQDGTWTGGGGGCGIWQAGSILASDDPSRLFFVTGNAYKTTVNQQSPANGRLHLDTLSEALVSMAIDPVTGVVTQQDYFEPYNYQAIDKGDSDLGGGGVSILPFTGTGVNKIAAVAGKNGQCYITNADNLGGYKLGTGGGDAVLQTITPPTGTAMFGNVGAYPLEGGYLYMTPVGSPTYAYALGHDGAGKPAFSLSGSTPDKAAGRVGTGSITITSNNGAPGSAILWMSDPDNGIRAYYAVPQNGQLVKITLPPTPVLPKFQRPVFGNGRYYINTYLGTILGFGSPVSLPFDCDGPYEFGEVSIGANKTLNATCTAKINVNKIANITIGNGLYSAKLSDFPSGAIKAGTVFKFPITFNLTGYVLRAGSTSSPSIQPGVQSGSITLVTVNGVTGYSTSQPLSVTGSTITDAPFAAINPVAVDFQPLVLGSASASEGSSNTLVLQNLGKSTMQILGYAYTIDSPLSDTARFTNITAGVNGTAALDHNGFFTAADLPAVGSTVAPGSSVIIHLNFLCSTLGDFYTGVTVWTDGGIAYSILTGSANAQPVALLEYQTGEGGWTAIPPCPDLSTDCAFQLDMGTSAGLTTSNMVIRFTNNGGSNLVIDKSKPPMGSVLGATNPNTDFHEGQAIKPGESAMGTLYFTPGSAPLNADPVVYSGAWTLNVNDLTFGVHVLNFTGTLKAPRVGPTKADGSPLFKYLGCYQDSTSNRIQTTQGNFVNNTNGLCQQFAVTSKAAFAGTEYTTECWVGRNIPAASRKVDDYLCNTYICPGDSSQFCGGFGSYVAMWYDTTGYFPANNSLSAAFMPPGNKATVGNYAYAGCRTDSTASRTLTGKTVGASNANSVESCAAACSGFTYFGVEWGVECYCGNTVSTYAAVAVESTCSYTCAGDPSELCGGSSRISLYALNGTAVTTPSSSSSTTGTATISATTRSTTSAAPTSVASSPAVVGNYSFVDCHTDLVAARTLRGKNTQSAAMTVEFCAAYCNGYTYFGVEYSQECFCGNDILGGSTTATDGRCSMVCSGNPLQICGGASGLSFYKQGGISGSSSSSSSASVSTTASVSASSSSDTVATTTSSSSTSSTSSAATPSVTVTCPNDDQTIYTTQNGLTFLLECYIDHFAGDLTMKYVSSYGACAETCSTTATCVAFSWQPGLDSPCYMKSSVGAANQNGGVWGAKVVTLPKTSSSTTSAAATTSSSSSSSSSSASTSKPATTSSSSSISSTSSSTSSSSTSSSTSSVAPTTSSSSSSRSSTSSSTSSAVPTTSSTSSTTSSVVPTTSSSSSRSSTSSSTSSSSTSSSTSSLVSTTSPTRSTTSSTTSTSSVSPTTSSSSSRSSTASSTSSTTSSVASTSTSSTSSTRSSTSSSTSSTSSTTSSTSSTKSSTSSTTLAPTTSSTTSTKSTTSSTSTTTTSATATPTAPAWTYAGCASDSTTLRALNGTSTTNTAMTIELCQAFCTSKNFPYAGLEYSTQCYCGLDLAPGYTYGQTGCSMACGGDATQTCGGKSRISVYQNTTYVMPKVVQTAVAGSIQATLQGCFVDNSTARVLPKYTWTSTTQITPSSCVAKCATKGYAVSGVEYGGECYCGDAVPPASALAPSPWDCRAMFCTGDSSSFCGAGKRILVYASG
ncbi:WSC domain-containing protein [Cercophora scortea]|uniref:WSC domain-containing protein n=1 Tax=Cercophora scortea TaxID=314031 RepID=A0AAE0IMR4_9PEZI|nr:WSC domain-containing protein [Cercophora scortea]